MKNVKTIEYKLRALRGNKPSVINIARIKATIQKIKDN